MSRNWLSAALILISVTSMARSAEGQPLAEATSREAKADSRAAGAPAPGTQEGFGVPNDSRFRIRVAFLAGYGHDDAQASLGFATQGRVGYAIITMEGKLNDHVSYRISVNPVNETNPAPACGEPDFFYPNSPAIFVTGPNVVPCEEDGNHRVDMYKYTALDNVSQQGLLREGYVDFLPMTTLGLTFGRQRLPVGFDWEEAGAYTSKDSTRIQRINAEADFGALMHWTRRRAGRPTLTSNAGVFLGDSHRSTDYNYFYFADSSLNTKGTLTSLVSATFAPTASLEVRGAVKHGYTGSRVERLPSYWASKRRDDGVIVSARYRPWTNLAVFGEAARYTWGPTGSTARLLGMPRGSIRKSGWYLGTDVSAPLVRRVRVGATLTREQLSRDDSLVAWLAAKHLYRVSLGKNDRSTIMRVHVDLGDELSIAVYHNSESTPFPWISGIGPVAGPRAFMTGGTNKWGIAVRMRLQ